MKFSNDVAGRVDKTIELLRSLGEEERFNDALQLLALAEQRRGLSPTELAYKARAIQLLEDEASPFINEPIIPVLDRAIELDWQYLPPLTDLAYFHLVYENDPKTALPHFREAVKLARWLLTGAVSGLATCIEELEGKRAARRELLQVHRQALLAEKLDPDFLTWIKPRKLKASSSETASNVGSSDRAGVPSDLCEAPGGSDPGAEEA